MEGIVIKTEPEMGPIMQENREEDDGRGAEGKVGCGGCDCSKENKLLRGAILELGKGKALLEDFLQVEFGEKFATFVKKREHLISLGFGGEDAKPVIAEEPLPLLPQGRDLTKKSDLVDLLTVIKEQADPSKKEKENVMPKPLEPTFINKTVENVSVPRPPPERELVWETPAQMKLQQGQRQPPTSVSVPKSIRICPVCQVEVHQQDFTRHLLDCHHNSKRVTCFECPLHFTARWKLVAHLQQAHGYGEDQAGVSATRSMMNREVRRWLTEMRKKAKAPVSPVLLGGGASRSGKGQKKICPFCLELKPTSQLRDHLIQAHQAEAPLTCSICEDEFPLSEMQGHLTEVHQLEDSEIDWITDLTGGNKMEEKISPWLNKMVREAMIPVGEQLVVGEGEINQC